MSKMPQVKGGKVGKPKTGQSWRDFMGEILDMQSGDFLDLVGGPDSAYGRLIAHLPRDVQIRHLLASRSIIELLTDPQANMLTAIMDRMDGKPTQPIEGDGSLTINVTYDDTIGRETTEDDA